MYFPCLALFVDLIDLPDLMTNCLLLCAAAGPSTTFRAGGGPGLFAWPTQNNSTPHTESLIDLTASDPEASPCCSE